MANLKFEDLYDFSGSGTPSTGFVVGYDLDGVLKQKDEYGVITPIGNTGGSGGATGLSGVLSIGNNSGTQNIIMGTSTSISSANGSGSIELDNTVDVVKLSTDDTSLTLSTSPELKTGTVTKYSTTTQTSTTFKQTITDSLLTTRPSVDIIDSGSSWAGGLTNKGYLHLNSEGSTTNNNITNSVIIGGNGLVASVNDTVYVQNIEIQNGLSKYNIDPSFNGGYDSLTMITKGNLDSATGSIWVAINELGNVSDPIYEKSSGFDSAVRIGSGSASADYSVVSGGLKNTINGTSSYSSISGGCENTVTGGYSVIGGGWNNRTNSTFSGISSGGDNHITGDGSNISGGTQNRIMGLSTHSFVGGGLLNTISCSSNSSISGGSSNIISSISGDFSSIGGGHQNEIRIGSTSVISGGVLNIIGNTFSISPNGINSFIGAGCCNTIYSDNSIINGGEQNTIGLTSSYSSINGGCKNTINSEKSVISGGQFNTSSGYYGHTIGGGDQNTISSLGPYITIGGGYKNTSLVAISTIGGGCENTVTGAYGVIGGGQCNTTQGGSIGGGINNTNSCYGSTIAGGEQNTSSSYNTTIGGGYCNTTLGDNATIGGGHCNTVISNNSIITGGSSNVAGLTSSINYVTIGGGYSNTVNGDDSTIGGGRCNLSIGGNHNVISGGYCNTIDCYNTTIGGGGNNVVYSNGGGIFSGCENIIATQSFNSIIGGGYYNIINGLSSCSSISGGQLNTISGQSSTIGGGHCNVISTNSFSSTIGGGCENTTTTDSDFSTIGGGRWNVVSGDDSTIGGGDANIISSNWSTIGGGYQNHISSTYSSILGGETNTSIHDNTHILGSNITTTEQDATYVNQLIINDTLGVTESNDNILVSSNGKVEVRDKSTLSYDSGWKELNDHNGSFGVAPLTNWTNPSIRVIDRTVFMNGTFIIPLGASGASTTLRPDVSTHGTTYKTETQTYTGTDGGFAINANGSITSQTSLIPTALRPTLTMALDRFTLGQRAVNDTSGTYSVTYETYFNPVYFTTAGKLQIITHKDIDDTLGSIIHNSIFHSLITKASSGEFIPTYSSYKNSFTGTGPGTDNRVSTAHPIATYPSDVDGEDPDMLGGYFFSFDMSYPISSSYTDQQVKDAFDSI